MCGIAGIVSKTSRDLGPLLEAMLRAQHHRGPDGAGMVVGTHCQRKSTVEALDFRNQFGTIALGHVRLAITGGATGVQPFQTPDGRLSLLHNGEIYNYRKLWKSLMGPAQPASSSDSEVFFKLLANEYRGDLVYALEKVLPHLDGVYGTAVTDQHHTIIARDRIGVRQLYYCFGKGLTAFASEKKSLKALFGNDVEIHRLPPGHMMILGENGHELRAFWTPDQIRTNDTIEDVSKALSAYKNELKEAVWKRIHDRDHVGIIYSGGIDSFMIASLVKQLGVPFTCYTAGRGEDAPDITWAKKTAKEHGFPLRVKTLSKNEIEELIPEVMKAIEDHSLNQVEVAIPIFASIRMAQEAGERVILTGQGADELFGGYPWYAAIVDREGYDQFVERSWEDTFLLYKECLEREDKIAMNHSMELRVPYVDPQVIEVAFAIAPQLKIRKGGDPLQKRIHRALSIVLGVPEEVAFREKEAAQHGANVHDVFEELARSHGYSKDLLNAANYDSNISVQEKLGSSSRYGYRYGDRSLWKPSPHVQYYLDTLAAEIGLLTGLPKLQWNATREKLTALGLSNGRTSKS
ncbi:MAG: hypothetical protein GTO51_00310 [Candidatus Latescibacteria bacterium]|nr:hypothetical protein [Candidatus Latescibacterota bacterium]NIM64424.1 hypothetical protein [Candidatus Latescibacterota bacterium]NIO00578.1 hypothetical protein [Candidatus Latescibacterota bacterium]NIO26978.1 hypothetical protein [Candidatus Latescibacterota bacterium]NIO56055.1 hypothetical protein [Candidatus Latescibacterota bacterium]